MPNLACELCGGTGIADYDNKAAQCSECNPPLEKPKRKPMKRTTMRKKSAKQRAVEKENAPFRKMWLRKVKTCMNCGQRMATEVHEVVAGSGRHLAYENPLTWMAVCAGPDGCHDKVQGIDFEKQLAILDRAHRRAINSCAIRRAV